MLYLDLLEELKLALIKTVNDNKNSYVFISLKTKHICMNHTVKSYDVLITNEAININADHFNFTLSIDQEFKVEKYVFGFNNSYLIKNKDLELCIEL